MAISLSVSKAVKTIDFWRMTFVRNDPRLAHLTQDEISELWADRVGAIFRLTPITILGNLINALTLTFVFIGSPHIIELLVWDLAMFGTLTIWLAAWKKSTLNGFPKRISIRVIKAINRNCLLIGALWAGQIYYLFPSSGPREKALLLCVACGMICGGALTLATLWQIALGFSLLILSGLVISVIRLGDPSYYAVLFFSISYITVVAFAVIERSELFINSRLNSMRLRALSARQNRQLHDIVEGSSEIHWNTDADGRLRDVTDKLAELLSCSVEQLENAELNTVFSSGRKLPLYLSDSSELRKIRSCFRHRRSIPRCTISPKVSGDPRCWAISGKPSLNDKGEYIGFSGMVTDITDLLNDKAVEKSIGQFDVLTGLPNRLTLQHNVESRFRSDSPNFAMLCIDLDGFKNINDTYGHGVGDELLRQCADRMRASVRPDELVSRIGGDEFVAVVSLSEPALVRIVANRLVRKLSEPYSIDGNLRQVGVSVGFAVAPSAGTTFKELLHHTDLALYRAKTGGKGQAMEFTLEMTAQHAHRRQLEMDLRLALGTPQISLNYQPIINLRSGRVAGCEALVRWNHPQHGNIPPSDFIPLAEETGIILELGNWITETACREAMTWPNDVRIAVNVSAIQFRNQGFIRQIETVLLRTGLDPSRLEVEITESVLIKDQARTIETFQHLKSAGIRISLDDFGTGYSSLAYLSDFPIDTIKIDRSFVIKMGQHPVAASIVQAITSLANNLGLATIGEGVETREQLQQLQDHGCDEVQGYLFSAPLNNHDIALLIALRNKSSADFLPEAPNEAAVPFSQLVA
ncbi:MAG: bifunctional diguanylate cyclase/phosphodiesterase [Hyphomicrobiales bacterium]|nr:bifunctional diguanylate cyclase/phosphodiesterase [Hyphomicrobiales bacterium]MDE2114387.1 bifunctional diguanylate cyclase/phosphodiesterase [Hyphomicrobiales bacterium]